MSSDKKPYLLVVAIGPTQIEWFLHLALLVKQKIKLDFVLFTLNSKDYKQAKNKQNGFYRNIYLISTKRKKSNHTDKEITDLEYGQNPFYYRDISLDRGFLYGYTSAKRAQNKYNNVFMNSLKIFESIGNPLLVLSEVNESEKLAIVRASRSLNFYPQLISLYPSRFYLNNSFEYEWEACLKKIKEKSALPNKYDMELLTSIRNGKIKPDWHLENQKKLNKWKKNKYEMIRHLKKIISITAYKKFFKFLEYHFTKKYLIDEMSKDKKSTNVIYYLHFQPEHTVEGASYPYRNQIETIRLIRRALPNNVHFYVKEHLPIIGRRAIGYYKKILKIPGVKMLDSRISTKEVLEQNVIVVTLTGTIALEAMVFKKPAVLLGNIYFKNFPGITQVTDPYKLTDIFYELIHCKEKNTARDDDILNVMASMREASYFGYQSSIYPEEKRYSEESNEAFISAFSDFYKKNKNESA